MDLRKLILEASHSHMVYMSLVPNARLLKWADILLQIEPILEIDASRTFGNPDDTLKREQLIYLFKRDLRDMVYEPIYAMANSIRLRLNGPDMPSKDPEYMLIRSRMDSINTKCEERKVDPDYDVTVLKNDLIKEMNAAFRFLNKAITTGPKYPEIKTRVEMIGE